MTRAVLTYTKEYNGCELKVVLAFERKVFSCSYQGVSRICSEHTRFIKVQKGIDMVSLCSHGTLYLKAQLNFENGLKWMCPLNRDLSVRTLERQAMLRQIIFLIPS